MYCVFLLLWVQFQLAFSETGTISRPELPRYLKLTDAEISARWQTLDAIEDYSYYEVWNEQDGWLNIGEKEVSILWNPDGIMVDNRKYYHEVWAGRVGPIYSEDKFNPRSKFVAFGQPKDKRSNEAFWEMYYRNAPETGVIVNLVQNKEKRKEPYFPSEPDVKSVSEPNEQSSNTQPVESNNNRDSRVSKTFGLYTVQLIRELSPNDAQIPEKYRNKGITYRQFSLKMEGEDREKKVIHLDYGNWVDMTAPDLDVIEALISFAEMSLGGRGSKNPMFVHCRAGLGRTGTLIALAKLKWADVVTTYEEGKAPETITPLTADEVAAKKSLAFGWDPVFDMVAKIRKRRPSLVYTKDQFAFLYIAVKYWWLQKHRPDLVPGFLRGVRGAEKKKAGQLNKTKTKGGKQSSRERKKAIVAEIAAWKAKKANKIAAN